ncbi:hypothetical protein [Amycolatopsis sp. BJA-103]|uniref:AAA family ATPase n=1 Tax=Amycolatopsis sp. BJA-103 TaxID=1911175 RepID=UPI000CB67033|nr:hypothetical protein [Amycolatopsis sp. BJA-103]PNE20429.1 hypothetical protein B1H26_00785 [Amycolatopsis sp. BJA-103]
MSKILLKHLSFVGASKESASIEFSEGLTVIYGASDTGKSYIVEAIDFMFGASRLRDIPEVAGYSHVLLGLQSADGDVFTLARSPRGRAFSLYEGDLRGVPGRPADRDLAATHGRKGVDNISAYLLQAIGMTGLRVQKNQKNETRDLSIRDVAHVCFIDETRMQAQRSPVLVSGQYISATAEKSVFRAFLTGEDDSALVSSAASNDAKKLSKGKIELLDSVIAELASQVMQLSEPDELSRQLGRLNAAISEQSNSIVEATLIRDRLIERRAEMSAQYGAALERVTEVSDLLARFGLLEEQYRSDLARLDMVREAGTLLGYFNAGVCVFCGADPEHQAHAEHSAAETTLLDEAVLAEHDKTSNLLVDLLKTIEDLKEQQDELVTARSSLSAGLENLVSDISRIDDALRPLAETVESLADSRSVVERGISIYEQIASLQSRKSALVDESDGGDKAAASALDLSTVREFTDSVRKVLNSWGVSEFENVAYDLRQNDLVVGDQVRASRGKGMRAILHAAFTVSLAKYCLERDLGHPGVIALDSPVVTFRGPFADRDGDLGSEDDELQSESVASNLYRQLGNEFDGQAIVVENVTPPSHLGESTKIIHFTGSKEFGRFGLFPVG